MPKEKLFSMQQKVERIGEFHRIARFFQVFLLAKDVRTTGSGGVSTKGQASTTAMRNGRNVILN
jgi:glutamate 5-kinase